jgi:hypothetical protein
LAELPILIEEDSQSIDACAAALGACPWHDPLLKPKWIFLANPPLHPLTIVAKLYMFSQNSLIFEE